MKLHVVTLVAGLLCAPVFAVAADQPAPAATKDSPDEMICTYEQTTGSHLGHRVCATRKQREERTREDQEALRNVQRSGSSGGNGATMGGH